jgi:Amiloride-sensitive sodium channel
MEKQENFTAISAIHGVNHIFSQNHSKFVRLFWIFAVLVSFCGFLFYLQGAWIKLMFEPEVLIKTRERNAEEFPFPAITICPRIFADHKIFKLRTRYGSTRAYKDEECKISFSNCLWYNPPWIKDLTDKFCPREKLLNVNIAETILNSSITPENLFVTDYSFSQRTSISGFGPCYTFNGLSYSELFNTKNIHEDFKQFQKFLKGTNIEDNSTWSPEKSLQLRNGSELKRLNLSRFDVKLKVSPDDTYQNLMIGKNFKLFIHKPNEIVTMLSLDYEMNYNEVRIGLVHLLAFFYFTLSFLGKRIPFEDKKP